MMKIRFANSVSTSALLVGLGLWAMGCSCDDEEPMAVNEAGMDDAGMDDAGADARPNIDGSTVDPAQQCVSSDVCGILDGSGCGDDMQCRIFQEEGAALTVACRESGSKEQGASCTMDFDCGPGLVCYNEMCLQYCCYEQSNPNSHMVCPEDAFCLLNYTYGEEGSPSPYGACVPQTGCDLIAQDCTGDGVGCYLLTRGSTASGYCLETADPAAAKGEACIANNDCNAGFLCVGDGECAQICDMNNVNEDCEEGEICNVLDTAPSGIGVCVTPQG